MDEETTHKMILKESHEGTDDWVCNECGREFLFTWHPYKREIITQGDLNAFHVGSKSLKELGLGVNADTLY